jgi:hypothetical protein
VPRSGLPLGSYLVTNKHVIADLSQPVFRANPQRTDSAREFELSLKDPGSGEQMWVGHKDPDVDVVVTGLNVEYLQSEGIILRFFTSDRLAYTSAEMVEEGVSEGDDVYLMGFPMSLVGGPRNAVIVRKGCVARFQDIASGASKSFLLDGYVFPGNSGGPVVIRPQLLGITGTKNVSRSFLIGIVSSYIPYVDVAVSQQTKRPRITFEENSGFTQIFPVEAITEATQEFARRFPLSGEEPIQVEDQASSQPDAPVAAP